MNTPYKTIGFFAIIMLIFGLKGGISLLVHKVFSLPEVYVSADTLGSGEKNWDIKGGVTSDGKPMPLDEVYRLVQQRGSYTPIPVSPDWQPKQPEK